MSIKGKFGSKTDIGLVRPTNEDKALSLIDAQGNIILCVCDGMGGYMKGDFASKIAVDVISAAFNNKMRFFSSLQVKLWIAKIIKSINYSVYSESQDTVKFAGMGTTLCLALFYKDKIFVANIGDSRAYMIGKEKLIQLTRDQTYVQALQSTGQISEQQKLTSKDRHTLMNYVGKSKNVNYFLNVYKNEGRSVLLCSDGLYNNAQDKQIYSTMRGSERLDQKINTLIGIAKSNGGTDNIAISIWEPIRND